MSRTYAPALPGLFTPDATAFEPAAAPIETEQARQLARVSGHIGARIVGFWKFKLTRLSKEFTADQLRQFIAEDGALAPASADRVMRDLRKRGVINYGVVNRQQSLYIALPVEE